MKNEIVEYRINFYFLFVFLAIYDVNADTNTNIKFENIYGSEINTKHFQIAQSICFKGLFVVPLSCGCGTTLSH